MEYKYLHFTNSSDAEKIKISQELWQSSYGPSGAVFAAVVGSSWVPNVQMSSMGRAKVHSTAIIFEADILPDYAMPEETVWHVKKLMIKNVKIIPVSAAKNLLSGVITSNDQDDDMLPIKLHPAFNIFGSWTRMPEYFSYWIPGKDNKKYEQARKIWSETGSISLVYKFWI